jgi:glycerol uptake facilitator-like aquaporin
MNHANVLATVPDIVAALGQLLSGIAAVGMLWLAKASHKKATQESKTPEQPTTQAARRKKAALDGFFGSLVISAVTIFMMWFETRGDRPVDRNFVMFACVSSLASFTLNGFASEKG